MKTVLFSTEISSFSIFLHPLKKQEHRPHCEYAGLDLQALHSPSCYHFGALFWLRRRFGKIRCF